ncbi:biotin/lipoyl-containing protein [Flavilitoribacter nigricans]|uniref:Acetyl-CoA carboxylase biotin carboxyl carrier protein subunit n=1 Tax=Flavilitoribacter nigricans (strain ATCC 23147 / DSM 23189 / NBRC 102662 / NCIMB 1420 / SS-2) TaxID=1122177 RepID=A0A2D0NFE2_FLAN2|nr:acetyl-CoA carboxylase biotin carboxyl carrier protein subunit [Flavilitoribacter nigricans]PHN07086.1 acetyl-CoA carboxylase biotin carboxyl carrier protein subunit [Flavilitoribacter nigricans DSM 23189 = NBRC 102662]
MKYKAIVDEQFEFADLSSEGIDLIPTGEGRFHVLAGRKAYEAVLHAVDWDKRVLKLQLNGKLFTVRLEDEYDQLIDQLGLQVTNQHQMKDIKAPMPGLVLKIEVAEGQEVQTGDLLVVLEAMKMENVIKAVADGKIKSIHTEEGNAVEKGQLLIEME